MRQERFHGYEKGTGRVVCFSSDDLLKDWLQRSIYRIRLDAKNYFRYFPRTERPLKDIFKHVVIDESIGEDDLPEYDDMIAKRVSGNFKAWAEV